LSADVNFIFSPESIRHIIYSTCRWWWRTGYVYIYGIKYIYVCHAEEISRAYIIIIHAYMCVWVCVEHIYVVRRPTSFPPADSENRIHVRNIMTVMRFVVVVIILLLLFRVIPDGTRRGSSQEALFVWRVVIVKTTAPVMNQTHHTRGG